MVKILNEIRYIIFGETEAIIAIISFLIAVIAFFSFKQKTLRSIALIALVVILLFGLNYIDLKYVNPVEVKALCKVPNVTNMSFSNAQIVLRSCGLNERIVGYDNSILTYENNQIVCKQEPAEGTEVEKGSTVILSFEEINVTNTPKTDLSLSISEYSVFTDGYYYEYSDPENPEYICIINFKTGICGTYEYSRALNETEQSNWFHGGMLYDANGKEILGEGNYPSFWSDPSGMFAVEFPEGLPTGTYTYELYQYIDGQYVSDSVDVIVGQ